MNVQSATSAPMPVKTRGRARRDEVGADEGRGHGEVGAHENDERKRGGLAARRSVAAREPRNDDGGEECGPNEMGILVRSQSAGDAQTEPLKLGHKRVGFGLAREHVRVRMRRELPEMNRHAECTRRGDEESGMGHAPKAIRPGHAAAHRLVVDPRGCDHESDERCEHVRVREHEGYGRHAKVWPCAPVIVGDDSDE